MKVYTEQALAEQEAVGTYPQGAFFYTAAALGLLLLQLSNAPIGYLNRRNSDSEAIQPSLRYVDNTQESTVVSIGVGAIEIFTQLNRVYDLLVRNSRDLDEESRKILYSNLWKLYD